MPNPTQFFNQFIEEKLSDFPSDLILTTNGGLEGIVIEEFKQHCKKADLSFPDLIAKPYGYDGHVKVKSKEKLTYYKSVIFKLRSVHHVLFEVYYFNLPEKEPLKFIHSKLSELDVPGMSDAKTFRVTSKRLGKHSFSSIDVQREAGSALESRYKTKVDLTQFDLEVRVDVIDKLCLVGLQLTLTSLTNRYDRGYIPRVSLKPHVAYGLTHLAYLTGKEERVLDPFVGSGTLLMEIGQLYPAIQLFGSDVYEDVIEGVKKNIENAGIQGKTTLQQIDVFELDQHFPENYFDAIITNSPFGFKLSKNKNFPNFFNHVLTQAAKILKPGGKMIILVMKAGMFKELVYKNGQFKIELIKALETGNIYPKVFRLVKKSPV